MSKTLRDLQAAATHYRWSSEANCDAWLTAQGVTDPQTRIALKHSFEACGKLTIRAQGLATDDQPPIGTLAPHAHQVHPETAPVGSELQALLRKAGLSLDRSYSEAEVTTALEGAQIGTMERIAVKHVMSERGCLRR